VSDLHLDKDKHECYISKSERVHFLGRSSSMNANLFIQQHKMPIRTLLWNFAWRSGAWGSGTGAVLGYLYGFAVIAFWSLSEIFGPENQLNLFDTIRAVGQIGAFAGTIGIIIGIPLGLLLGLANGLIIGIVTLFLFPALPHIQRYLNVVRFISMSVTISGSIAALNLTVMRQTDYAFAYMILPAIVAGLGAWWVSGRMTKWYARVASG
jgi:hypothetical protein